MSLRGNLGEFSALETLQLIGQQQKTGTLDIRSGRRSRGFVFVDGRLLGAAPEAENDPDPLLATLAALGWIQADRLRALQTAGATTGLESLRQHCPVAGELLAEVRRTVLQGMLDEVLLWSRGRFRFSPETGPVSDWPPFPLEEMLLESMRRLDETAELRAAGLRPETVPRCDDAPGPPPVLEAPSSWIAPALLPRCDGRKNLRRLGAALALPEYDVLITVQALERSGHLHLRRRGPTGATIAEPLRLPHPTAPLHLAAVIAAVLVCGLGAHVVTTRVTGPVADAALTERIHFDDERAVRHVLEIYHRRHACYPPALTALAGDGLWPDPLQDRLRSFKYRSTRDGQGFTLE